MSRGLRTWALIAVVSIVARPSAAAVERVVVVFKTHFDIGYTAMASEVVQRYRTAMIDQALAVCDQSRGLPAEQQFAWTIPGWPLHKILEDWPGQTPERKERVMAAFRAGRFVVHALPFTTHTELLEAEDLVRGLGYATRLSQAAGLPLPCDAKMTDVPSHSWVLPTLLADAGVRFLHLGCNAASTSPQVPRLFLWEGPDGSRLLTMYTAESYGTGLVPPADWPHKTWLALIHTGDNHGPPAPAEVTQVLREAAQKLPGVRVTIGRMSDFADAILQERAELPVVRGDMPDTWIHGPLSDPVGAKLARTVRPMLATTEALHTQLGAWSVAVPDTARTIAAAYEQSLCYGEHTWGGAFSWIYGKFRLPYGEAWKEDRAQGKFRRIEASWDEHTAYIEKARDLVTPLLDSDLRALAGAVAVAGKRIVVYNPLPWRRSGLAVVSAWPDVVAVRPQEGGDAIAGERDGATLRFLACDLPAMGYRTYVPAEAPPVAAHRSADPRVLEGVFFKATFDPERGVVSSLLDKRTGRELVDAQAPHGMGAYLYERFDKNQVAGFVKAYVKIDAEWGLNELGKPTLPGADTQPYRAASPRGFAFRSERTVYGTVAIMEAPAGESVPHGVATRMVFYDDLPCVDIELTLRDKPLDPWPEAGWLCLPINAAPARFLLGRLGGIVDPAADVVEGSNFQLFGINGGLAVLDREGRGVGLCPLDSPLVSLGAPGCWRYTRQFEARPPRVYVNLFNNQWSTNFRLWQSGSWTSRVRLWPIDAYEPSIALVTPSLEARYPVCGAAYDGAPGALSPAREGLALSQRGVAVAAFGPDPDGGGIVLRLWELAGTADTCRVKLPEGFGAARVQPIDVRGRPRGEALPVTERTFETPLRAFAPASFRIAGP